MINHSSLISYHKKQKTPCQEQEGIENNLLMQIYILNLFLPNQNFFSVR